MLKLVTMRALRKLGRVGLHSLNGIEIFRRVHARRFRILMYHHFLPDPSAIREQCAHIRRYYSPVPMKELARSLTTRGVLPSNALAVTIDDGFRDFLLYGFPAFREFGIPVTVYLVTDFLDRTCWLWWNEIQYAVENSGRSTIEIDIDNHRCRLPLFTAADRAQAGAILIEALKELPTPKRQEMQARIIESLDVTLPSTPPLKWEPLSWEEVRRLSEAGVEFGAHTRTHPILASIQDQNELHEEIAGSKRRLEQELRAPVLHFCYPNGRAKDIGPQVLEHTRACGFSTGVTTECGMNHLSEADPLALRRIAVDPETPDYYFAELLAGFRSS